MLAGIVVSILPVIIKVAEGKEVVFSSSKGLGWSFIFMGSMMPAALSLVFAERFFKSRIEVPERSHLLDLFTLSFWANLFQLLTMAILFWVDVIPGFGFSSSVHSFLDHLVGTSQCFVDPVTCPGALYFGIAFIGAMFFTNVLGNLLSADSANFSALTAVIATPLATIFWLIFPKIAPSPTKDPLWSVIPAFVMLVLATILWKVWERSEVKRIEANSEYTTLIQ
eukprot:TRINITY_DN1097_c0_g1_i1.p1 TRINITY_DN1097_c0_g1~~TRINITY_DN1097_c0_g1_i1.p1  ORF type:complete len:224 (+),score=34.92 TRINITY_DN1097_c0_g1_i1:545-1216(+)